jgi:hypothetical protein
MLKIKSRHTVICAHPYTRKLVGRGESIDEPAYRAEMRGEASDDQVREWLAKVGATVADVHVWGSYQKPMPGRFDPHPHRISDRQVTL